MRAKKKSVDKTRLPEIIKCGKDPIYFINTYLKIQHPTKGLLPFNTYPFQDECVQSFIDHRFSIILKSRQLGISTIVSGYAVWLAIFHRDKNILAIATGKDTAINIVKKVKVMVDGLPDWLLVPTVIADNLQQVQFSNGSQIKAVATSKSAGRSEALSLLICDETAWIDNFSAIWTGLMPTLSTGGSAILFSSPAGVGNTFHEIWTKAEAGENEFNAIRLPWDVHPEHDIQWLENETRGQSPMLIAQEYMCEFQGSADTFIQTADLLYLGTQRKDPIEKSDFNDNLWVWNYPISGYHYVISADVARGNGSDYSTFHIICQETCEIVAEYKNKISPDDFGKLLNMWGRKYNNALMCPEINSYGHATGTELQKLEYPNLFYQTGNARMYSTNAPDSTSTPGIYMSSNIRPLIMNNFEQMIRNKELKSYSSRLHGELLSFTMVNGKPVAIKGCHDDLVMSAAIGAWVLSAIGFMSNSHQSTTELIGTMFTTKVPLSNQPGLNIPSPYAGMFGTTNQNRPLNPEQAERAGYGNQDYSWLLDDSRRRR